MTDTAYPVVALYEQDPELFFRRLQLQRLVGRYE